MNIKEYISECFATPINTIGMGDVSISGDTLSEPIGLINTKKNKPKTKNKHKMIIPIKKYLLQKINS